MTIPQRGDIFWADLPLTESVGSEQYGKRPVLVVSADMINSRLPIVVIVPLTGSPKKKPGFFRILIPEQEKTPEPGTKGCPGDSIALTEQIRTVSRSRLEAKRVGYVSNIAMAAVEAGIAYVLSMP